MAPAAASRRAGRVFTFVGREGPRGNGRNTNRVGRRHDERQRKRPVGDVWGGGTGERSEAGVTGYGGRAGNVKGATARERENQ